MKPTIVYSARQHANEVSSTSHVLKMAELLLTDPVYRDKLNKVNVVIHPITNADGAQLAYDLQKINPTYMLHAGYLGALGVDVTNAQWDADPIYPESGIRPKIWRTWLPGHLPEPARLSVTRVGADVLGVRGLGADARRRDARLLDDARLVDARVRLAGRSREYPRHKDEQMKLLNMITEYVKAAPGDGRAERARLRSLQAIQLRFRSEELQARFHERRADLQVDQGRPREPAEPGLHDASAERDDLGGRTEAPDETARGDWLKLVANAGLQWDKAILEYLVLGRSRDRAQGRSVLERREPDA